MSRQFGVEECFSVPTVWCGGVFSVPTVWCGGVFQWSMCVPHSLVWRSVSVSPQFGVEECFSVPTVWCGGVFKCPDSLVWRSV